MRIPRSLFLGLGALAICGPFLLPSATAQLEYAGQAYVIDGDTIEVNGLRIRLYGIDSPEREQTCTRPGGKQWACGVAATSKLLDLINGQPVRCQRRDIDRYGRIVAICFAGALDLNGEMVRTGMAVSYKRYSHRYDVDEIAARLARRGIWDSPYVVSPEEWRHRR